MNTLILGIGECGRNILLELYHQLSSMQYKYLMRNFEFFVTDSESTVKLVADIERKGISKDLINPEKIDEKMKPLIVFMLTPISSYGGVGGAWTVSSEITQEFLNDKGKENKKYIDIIDFSSKFVDCFNIFNSAGGGTGSGAGPVFLEYLRNKSTQQSQRKLYSSTIVLPFKDESGRWRDVNAASNIARYSELCDIILIADNEHLKNQIKKDTKIVQKAANDLLGNVWKWINACSSPQLAVSPKRWESADFKRSFQIGNRGAPVVPCYREEPVEILRKINLALIVLRTIKENCAAKCLPHTSKRVLVIVSKPENVGSTTSESDTESDIKDYLIKWMFKDSPAIDVIFITGKAMIRASITVLLVAPEIPRLEEMVQNYKAYLDDQKLFERDFLASGQSLDDIWNAYKDQYENFKNYLEYLKIFN
jgi:hypothetical protein